MYRGFQAPSDEDVISYLKSKFYKLNTISRAVAWFGIYPILPSVQLLMTLGSYFADNWYGFVSAVLVELYEMLLISLTTPLYNKKTTLFFHLIKLILVFMSYWIVSVKVNLSNKSEISTFVSASNRNIYTPTTTDSNGFRVTTLKHGTVSLNEFILNMPKNTTYKIYEEIVPNVLGMQELLVMDNWDVKLENASTKMFNRTLGKSGFTGSVVQLASFGLDEKYYTFIGRSSDGSMKVLAGSENKGFTSVNYEDTQYLRMREPKLHERNFILGEFGVHKDFSILFGDRTQVLSASNLVLPIAYNWLNHSSNFLLSPRFFHKKPISTIRLTRTGNLYTQESRTVFNAEGHEELVGVKNTASWLLLLLHYVPFAYALKKEKKNKTKLVLSTLPLFTFMQGLTLIETEFKLIFLLSLNWFSLHSCSFFGYSDRLYTSILRFNKILNLAKSEESCFRQAVLRRLGQADPGFALSFEEEHISSGRLKLNDLFFTAYLVNVFDYQLSFFDLVSYSFFEADVLDAEAKKNFPKPLSLLLKDGITYRLFTKQGYMKNFTDFETTIICYNVKKTVFINNLREYGLMEKYSYNTLVKTLAYIFSNLRKPLPYWAQGKNVAIYDMDFQIPLVTQYKHETKKVSLDVGHPASVAYNCGTVIAVFNLPNATSMYTQVSSISRTKEIKGKTYNTSQLYSKANATRILTAPIGTKKLRPISKILNGCCTKCLSTKKSSMLVDQLQKVVPLNINGRRRAHSQYCVKGLNEARKLLEKIPTKTNREVRSEILKEKVLKQDPGVTSPLDKILLVSDTAKKLKKIAKKRLVPKDLKGSRKGKYLFFPTGDHKAEKHVQEMEIRYSKPSTVSATKLKPPIQNGSDILNLMAEVENDYGVTPTDTVKLVYNGRDSNVKIINGQFFWNKRNRQEWVDSEGFMASLEKYLGH
jgi:hypothetical protein